MISFRKLFIVFLGFMIVFAIGVVVFSLNKTDDEKEVKTIAPFSITGLTNNEYEFDSQTQASIVDGIGFYLKRDGVNTTNLTGEARDGSFKKEVNDEGIVTSVLVDIPAAKRSYKVTSSHDIGGYKGLYILCPAPDELKYGAFDCKADNDE